jgi:hypothetical protein
VDELDKYYELLGVRPGASAQEMKTAHRDLAKVWHPDRFAHDPRLQQKAQEKLKEINEAYDQLTTAKTGRRPPRASAPPEHSHAPAAPARRRGRLHLVLLALLVSGLVFFSAFRALTPSAEQRAQSAPQPEPQESEDSQRPESSTVSPKLPRGKQPETERESQPVAAPPAAEEVRALPTVTVTIDPTTGQLATPACPAKSRMTYPAGNEPRQFCTAAHQRDAPAETERPRAKESRLKSFGKRLKGIVSSGDN